MPFKIHVNNTKYVILALILWDCELIGTTKNDMNCNIIISKIPIIPPNNNILLNNILVQWVCGTIDSEFSLIDVCGRIIDSTE